MPEMIHLNTNAFVITSVAFLLILIYSLYRDLENFKTSKKTGLRESFNTKKCKTIKICKSFGRGALRGAITGSIIGGAGGATAGAFIMGVSSGVVTFIE